MDPSYDYTNVTEVMEKGLSTAIPAISEGVSEAIPVISQGVEQAAAAAIPMAELAAETVSKQTGVQKGVAKWLILGAGLYFGWGLVKGMAKPILLGGAGYLLYRKMKQKPKSLAGVGYAQWAKR